MLNFLKSRTTCPRCPSNVMSNLHKITNLSAEQKVSHLRHVVELLTKLIGKNNEIPTIQRGMDHSHQQPSYA